MTSIDLGSLKLTLVSDGPFRLDGGAMFGVVPRVLWQQVKPPDDQNRISMRTNCLLVESGDDLLLLETGIGDKNDAAFRRRFGMEGDGTDEEAVRLPAAIRRAGYELGDVTHVLLTHLHFDHCGWNTRRDGSGNPAPTFPRARYHLQRGEVEHGRRPNDRDRASYLAENWEPLFDAGVVELFDDEVEPLPGVRAIRAPGHNDDMCIVRLDGGAPEHQAVWWADLVPTVAHLPYPWVMGYDLHPVTTMENKAKWLPQAADGDWLCFFGHEDEHPVGRLIELKPGRYRAAPVPRAPLETP